MLKQVYAKMCGKMHVGYMLKYVYFKIQVYAM